jgi:hypothetical protein
MLLNSCAGFVIFVWTKMPRYSPLAHLWVLYVIFFSNPFPMVAGEAQWASSGAWQSSGQSRGARRRFMAREGPPPQAAQWAPPATMGEGLEKKMTCRTHEKGFLYRPVYFYRYPAVRVYRSGINGITLLTARIQIPNQNHLYKRYKVFIPLGKDLYRSANN